MKKKKALLSVLLSISVFVTGIGITSSCVFASSQDIVSPYSIGSATAYLEKKASSTLSYRVTANTNEGISGSITAKIVLQKYESGKWLDKETITRTEKNVPRFDVTGTIDVKSYGIGNYRIKVTVSDVYNGIIDTLGPIYSGTVTV